LPVRNVSSLAGLRPSVRPAAERLLALFPELTVTSVYRSYTDQLALWLARDRNPFPVAPPGQSMHERGLAWDMTGPLDRLQEAGRVWRSWGGRWAESDPIHFEARASTPPAGQAGTP